MGNRAYNMGTGCRKNVRIKIEDNMQIKMTQNAFGSINASGNATKEYKIDEIIDCKEDWQKSLGQIFLDNNLAIEVKVTAPKEKKVSKKKTKAKK